MSGLPIVKMTLYKHGVGFFERHGKEPGETVSLDFRKEQMNDVLKSLTAVATGGQVLGVDYQTPEDKEELLDRSSILLSDRASLRDLLADVRGRRIAIKTTGSSHSGIVVGVDLTGDRESMGATLVSLFVPETREVFPLRLADILGVTLEDERAAADLSYFLETSLTEEDKRAVTVRLSSGTEAINISYIAPSPVWRVSYRLVTDEVHVLEGGEGLLQGWALFDNTLDEDLENVDLAFVAGMPVSFIYDLYTPFTPTRPVIQEETREVAAPVEFAGALDGAAHQPMAAARLTRAAFGEAAAAAPKRGAAGFGAAMADVAASTTVTAMGQAQGEFFSYAVANPVTVRRGRSAMAPILQSTIALKKERLYNGRKQSRHPVIAMRFKNLTGLTLERGPLTVIEEGEYAGEAILPFTASEGDIYLAYAVDLGVTVTEEPKSERRLESVRIKDGLLVVQEWDIQAMTYRVENRSGQALRVTLEHPALAGFQPYDTPDPAERTPEHYRYALDVPASKTVSFVARQRRLMARREEIHSQTMAQLAAWLQDKALDKGTYNRLAGIRKLYDEIATREQEIQKNAAGRQQVLEQQKTIQGNLSSLRDTGEEGQLRTRYARTLAEQEDRLAGLDRADKALRETIEGLKGQIEQAIKNLA